LTGARPGRRRTSSNHWPSAASGALDWQRRPATHRNPDRNVGKRERRPGDEARRLKRGVDDPEQHVGLRFGARQLFGGGGVPA
jgi:hypothetical protein